MNIVGLSAFYHESACCLLVGGRLVAAAAEERFSRIKHDARLPVQAFRFCLERAGLTPADIDCLAYYEQPEKKLARQLWAGLPANDRELAWLDAERPLLAIRRRLGYEGPIICYPHHLSHAASAFFYSDFKQAAILTVDGVGEWATMTYGRGQQGLIELFEEVRFPHSLGLLYAAITAYLGFRVNSGEYKVMGLAAYGRSRYVDQMRQLIENGPTGQFQLDMRFFDFVEGLRMYSPALVDLFGRPPREPESELTTFHQDVACSLQLVVEEFLLAKARYLAEQVPLPDLCLAGGVALNSVANGRLAREGPFKRIFIQPAAGDAGGCLGAAALAHLDQTGRPADVRMEHVYWGPAASSDEIAQLLATAGLPTIDFRGREDELIRDVAGRLAANQVVGWFQGAMEFGPRALGNRSILANPKDPTMGDILNKRIKHREAFRPFAPAVLWPQATDHFDLDHLSPFMLETCQVNSPLDLPAITHIDGSARPQTVTNHQNPRLARLLEAFHQLAGCPILLNTSLNVRGEPIVCSPSDALMLLGRTELDVLVLGDFIVERSSLPPGLPALLAHWTTRPAQLSSEKRNVPQENLYTFV